jgi:hypothetical protein
MRFIKIIILAFCVVLVIAFFTQNQEVFTREFELKLDLKFYQIGPYLTTNIVIILMTFLIGVLFAIFWGAFHTGALKSRIKNQQLRIRELEDKDTEPSPSIFGSSVIGGGSSSESASEETN